MALTKKFLAPMVLLFVAMLAMPCFAAITSVTISEPVDDSVFNNNPANRRVVPITFAYVDANTTAGNDQDFNITLNSGSSIVLVVLADTNAYDVNVNMNPTSTVSCNLKNPSGDSGTCTMFWTMPLNTELGDGSYDLVVNVRETGTGHEVTNSDSHALTISTGMATSGITKSILVPVGLVLIAGIVVAAILGMLVLNADPMKTTIATIAGVIIIAFIVMVFGMILGMM